MVTVMCPSTGSGSTYVYGYCDAHFKPQMTRDECLEFVQSGKSTMHHLLHICMEPLLYMSSKACR